MIESIAIVQTVILTIVIISDKPDWANW